MDILHNARWIWDEKNTVNQYVIFRREFDIAEPEESYSFAISAHGEYALFINGKFIQFNQYHSFPQKKAFDKFQISGKQLRCGRNVIEIIVYNQNVPSAQYIKNDGMLIFALCGESTEIVSDERVLCCTEPHYKNGEMPRITPQLGFTYEYDARANRFDFHAATVLSACPELYLRPVEKLRILPLAEGTAVKAGYFTYPAEFKNTADRIQRAALDTVPESSDGRYIIYELDTEYAGLFCMELTAEEGCTVNISYGEHLADGHVRAEVGSRSFASTYIADGKRRRFVHYFSRIAARYLQLNISGSCEIHEIGILPTEYPLAEVQIPDRLSAEHKKIYETAARTLKLCMHEHYEDTPWREQALYSMDSRTEALCSYYLWQCYDFAGACIRLLGEVIKPSGFLELNAPAVLEFTIPIFSFAWIAEVCEYLTYSGRAAEAGAYTAKITAIFDRVLSDTANGYLKTPCGREYWNYYEWSDGISGIIGSDDDGSNRFDAPYQLFFLLALQKGIEVLRLAGCDTSKYEAFIPKLKKQLCELFFDEDSGLFCTFNENGRHRHYCELVQSLAVICEVLDDSSRLRAVLADRSSELVKISLSNYIFKYDALLSDNAYTEYVLKDIAEVWGGMLKQGAQTFWEVAKGESAFGNAGSLCHGWSAVPIYIYHKYILPGAER